LTALLGCASDAQRSGPAASNAGEQSSTREQPALTPAGQECFDAWNAASNAANRDRVARAFTVAAVTLWDAEEEDSSEAEAQGEHEFDGCGYLFHDDERSLEFSGRWEADGLVIWEVQPQSGLWTPEQEAAVEDDAAVAADGTLTFSPEG